MTLNTVGPWTLKLVSCMHSYVTFYVGESVLNQEHSKGHRDNDIIFIMMEMAH